MNKRKLFKQIKIILVILINSLIIVSAVFFAYSNISAKNNKLNNIKRMALVSVKEQMDSSINTCFRLIEQVIIEDKIVKFAVDNEVDYLNLTQINSAIRKNGIFYQEIGCMWGIFKSDSDIFITSQGIFHTKEIMGLCDFNTDFTKVVSDIPDTAYVNGYISAYEYTTDDSKRINFILKRTVLQEEEKELYCFVSFDTTRIIKELDIPPSDGFVILGDEKSLVNSNPNVSYISDETLGSFSDVIYNMQYVYVSEKSTSVIQILLGVFLITILVGFGFVAAHFLTLVIYKPVKNILAKVSGNSDSAIYDEEAYIRQEFEKIGYHNEKLSKEIYEYEVGFKQNFLRDTLFGLIENTDVEEKIEKYELQLLQEENLVALLEYNKGENALDSLDIKQTISFIEKNIKNSAVVAITPEQIALIVSETDIESLKKSVTQLVIKLEDMLGISYTAAISDKIAKGVFGLCDSFSEALEIMKSKYLYYNMMVMTTVDLKELDVNSYYYPLDIEKSIINYIIDEDYVKATQTMKAILDKNLNKLNISRNCLTEFKFAIVATLKRILQVLNKSESDIFGEGSIAYLELNTCRTTEELEEKILAMFSSITDYVTRFSEKKGDILVGKIEEYINQNYMSEDLSLTSIAERFNLTIGYLSKMFKKHKLVNFKEYITNYRIQKAKEILEKNPDVKVGDLSKQVGYDNVNSFIRNFKRNCAVSPNQFKHKL